MNSSQVLLLYSPTGLLLKAVCFLLDQPVLEFLGLLFGSLSVQIYPCQA